MYDVLFAGPARRFFENADAPLQRKLDRCFNQLRLDPRRHNNIKALKGKLAGLLRFRVGDWRVLYRIDEPALKVLVLDVAHRREVHE